MTSAQTIDIRQSVATLLAEHKELWRVINEKCEVDGVDFDDTPENARVDEIEAILDQTVPATPAEAAGMIRLSMIAHGLHEEEWGDSYPMLRRVVEYLEQSAAAENGRGAR